MKMMMMMMINRTAAQTTRRRRGPADRCIEIKINIIYIVILLHRYNMTYRGRFAR